MGDYRSNSWLAAALLLGLTGDGAGAAAQAIPRPQTPVFGADVAVVAVPVFVTDKNGKSVPGLTIDDFEVEDGGKKVPIVAFQAIDVDAPTATTPAATTLTANLPAAVQAAAPRQFMVLIDQQFSPTAGLLFGRKAALNFLRETLAPGDLAAVATSGPNGFRVLTNFTKDHEKVALALDGKGVVAAPGSDPLGLGGGFGAVIGMGSLADQHFEDQNALLAKANLNSQINKITAFLEDLRTLVAQLSPLRGRKQIVLMSSSFPEGVLWTPEGAHLRARMEAIYQQAAASDVVIHGVSLSGIAGPVDLTSRTGRDDSLGDGPRTEAQLAQLAFEDRWDAGRDTLIALAHGTGGHAILPRNDFGKALSEVDQISRQSYVIAFEAAELTSKGDKPRSLKVRVRGEGHSVSHRASYGAPDPAKALDAKAVKQLAAEAISKGLTEGPLRLHLTALPHRDREGKLAVHASLLVEGPELAAAAQGSHLGVQVYGYVLEDGAVLDSLVFNTSVDLHKYGDAARDSGIRILTAFPVSAGIKDLRFFVRVGDSDLSGSIRQSVDVPKFEGSSPVLSPPLFGLPLEGNVVIPFQPKDRPRIDVPFRVGDQSFVPEAPVRLAAGTSREVCVFVWPALKGDAPAFDVTAEIVGPGQASRPVTFDRAPVVVKDSDGVDRYVIQVIVPQASSGSYTLRLTFRDPGTGQKSATETIVWIEN